MVMDLAAWVMAALAMVWAAVWAVADSAAIPAVLTWVTPAASAIMAMVVATALAADAVEAAVAEDAVVFGKKQKINGSQAGEKSQLPGAVKSAEEAHIRCVDRRGLRERRRKWGFIGSLGDAGGDFSASVVAFLKKFYWKKIRYQIL